MNSSLIFILLFLLLPILILLPLIPSSSVSASTSPSYSLSNLLLILILLLLRLILLLLLIILLPPIIPLLILSPFLLKLGYRGKLFRIPGSGIGLPEGETNSNTRFQHHIFIRKRQHTICIYIHMYT